MADGNQSQQKLFCKDPFDETVKKYGCWELYCKATDCFSSAENVCEKELDDLNKCLFTREHEPTEEKSEK